MKVLCPDCNQSVVVDDSAKLLKCPHCHLEANLSQIGTSPGVAASTITRDLSGDTLAGYRLIEVIGTGGMGIVYRAEQVSDGQVVALKILSCENAWKEAAFISRFNREISALKRLNHPQIVQILDSGTENGIHFLVTEYVDGENLAERLKRRPMGSEEAARLMEQVLSAIGYAHDQGVVHRDIKPANILLSKESVKVLDFGLAQISGGETVFSTLTRTNLAMGTFNYLSPEQRLCAKNVDHRADIFSLGVVLFEMLTGTLPLGHFDPPSRVKPGVDKRFDKVVQKSLARRPEDRFQDTDEFWEALNQTNRKGGQLKTVAALVLATVGLVGAAVWGLGGDDSEDAVKDQAVDVKMMSASKGKSSNVELNAELNSMMQQKGAGAQVQPAVGAQVISQQGVQAAVPAAQPVQNVVQAIDDAPAEPVSISNVAQVSNRRKKPVATRRPASKTKSVSKPKSRGKSKSSKIDMDLNTSDFDVPLSPKEQKLKKKKERLLEKKRAAKQKLGSETDLEKKPSKKKGSKMKSFNKKSFSKQSSFSDFQKK